MYIQVFSSDVQSRSVVLLLRPVRFTRNLHTMQIERNLESIIEIYNIIHSLSLDRQSRSVVTLLRPVSFKNLSLKHRMQIKI